MLASQADSLVVTEVLQQADRFDFAGGKDAGGDQAYFSAQSKDKRLLVRFEVQSQIRFIVGPLLLLTDEMARCIGVFPYHLIPISCQQLTFAEWPQFWDGEMLFFGQLGYRVIAHDRRGRGRSEQTWDGNEMKRIPTISQPSQKA